MELLELPVAETSDTEAAPAPENRDVDRIAFELWQRSSLPQVADSTRAELEEVADHASCL